MRKATLTQRVLAALLLSLPIIAGAQSALYSKTFYARATGGCDGQDRLAWLQENGEAEFRQLMPPWENVPIKIVGVEILAFESTPVYMFAGNAYSPDVMLMVKGEYGKVMYPAGFFFAFPAAGAQTHIDLHYSCLNAPQLQAFYTIYYTK